MKILSMPAGGANIPLQFPPADGWVGSGTASGITVGTSLYCTTMTGPVYADFSKVFSPANTSRTITANIRTVRARVFQIWIDGVQVASEGLSSNSSGTITATLPAGNHTVFFRIWNMNSWPADGTSYIDMITCS